MKSFETVIKDPVGIHARPAGLLVKKAKSVGCKVTIQKGEKSVDATKLMALMGMGIKCGDTVIVQVEGAEEEAACQEMKTFFDENL